ncbi:hypothetical protein QJS10_CPB19g00526 [Acorus calamus]|uniref:Uncharacterized protein n=1 Tax=Acorus calamus TaxID=4465 RepID=A0AAV9CHF2_ACOCL|nr:hypothetical protein QJS10_CPB19g00526 [Acorus calamus]
MIGARGNEAVGGRWITRSKLVDQLRDYQIRSHHKWVPLTFFSSNPHITSRADVVAALSSALLFLLLIISSFVTLYFRYFRLSAIVVLLMILLPVCLKVCRQRKLAKKRERRLLLPLSV